MPELTPSMIALQDIELHKRAFKVRQLSDGTWKASVTAGYSNGACPCWPGEGETREEALEAAAGRALRYWQSDFGPGSLTHNWTSANPPE